MRGRVYIETTIPSVYHETRSEPETVVRRKWTREWWEKNSHEYELLTSEAVIEELETGSYPHQDDAIALAQTVPLLEISPPIGQIVASYLSHKLMPADPGGDALHLAIASFHRCDFLLTWNCHHLANANKFAHIRRINVLLGLFVPTIVTPLELLGGDEFS